MIKTKKQMYMVIGIFALVLFLGGTTYAFFNYTRTGVANNIRTGRIYFNTAQSNTLNLTNVFPMSATDAGNANLDAVSVRIYGDTTYSGGEEFEISIVDVNNTIGSGQSVKTIPINYIALYSATPVQSGDPNVIGTNSDSYFTARGQSSPVYQLKTTGEATNGEQVLIGYIPSGATGIDGTLTIKAYLDSSKIAISDTYNDGNTPTDNMGTPASFGEGRTVLTTTEWNALQNTQTPLSFKIKAVSQEGTWVEAPLAPGAIETCPGCKFLYINDDINPELAMWTTWNTNGETPTVLTSGLYDSYLDVVSISGKPFFLGVKLNNQYQITNAYACGIYDGSKPFCIEGTPDGSNYGNNSSFINGPDLWNSTCEEYENDSGYDVTTCDWDSSNVLGALAESDGTVNVGFHDGDYCGVNDVGYVACRDY